MSSRAATRIATLSVRKPTIFQSRRLMLPHGQPFTLPEFDICYAPHRSPPKYAGIAFAGADYTLPAYPLAIGAESLRDDLCDIPPFDLEPTTRLIEDLDSPSPLISRHATSSEQTTVPVPYALRIADFVPEIKLLERIPRGQPDVDHRGLDTSQGSSDHCGVLHAPWVNKTSHGLLRALLLLGLGHPSEQFPINRLDNSFHHAFVEQEIREINSCRAWPIVDLLLSCGNASQLIRGFSEKVHSELAPQRTAVAFANLATSSLDVVRACLDDHAGAIHTYEDLGRLFARPRQVLLELESLLGYAELPQSKALAECYDHIAHLMKTDAHIAKILVPALNQMFSPWLQQVAVSVGLMRDPNMKAIDSSTLASNHILGDELTELIADSCACMTFLRAHHPEHTLLESRTLATRIRIAATSTELGHIRTEAQAYAEEAFAELETAQSEIDKTHLSLRDSKKQHEVQQGKPVQPSLIEGFEQGMRAVQHAPPAEKLPDAEYARQIRLFICGVQGEKASETTLPIDQAIRLSVMPLIKARHRLLCHATIDKIIHSHQLRQHLNSRYVFHLWASGDFCFRMQHHFEARCKGRFMQHTAREQDAASAIDMRTELSTFLEDVCQARDMSREDDACPQPSGNLSFSLPRQDGTGSPAGIAVELSLPLSYTSPQALSTIFTAAAQRYYHMLSTHNLHIQQSLFALRTARMTIAHSGSLSRRASLGVDIISFRSILALLHRMRHFCVTLASHVEERREAYWRSFMDYLDDIEIAISTHNHEEAPSSVRFEYAQGDALATLAALSAKHEGMLLDLLQATFQEPPLEGRAVDANDPLAAIFEDVSDFAASVTSSHVDFFDDAMRDCKGKKSASHRGSLENRDSRIRGLDWQRKRFDTHVVAFIDRYAERAHNDEGYARFLDALDWNCSGRRITKLVHNEELAAEQLNV
ncbi:hypothetical protein MRB53_041643 [Persea americana]|nr:hypothetical protein MRB53_041643 [Persea americana]